MATVTGSLKDFQPQPLGTTAELIFTPHGPAASSVKSLLVSASIRVTPASDGTFSVALASYTGTNPNTAYRLRVEWFDAAGNYRNAEEIPWDIVVTGDGQLTDFFANVEPGKLLVKGDTGDSGDVASQALIDAISARTPIVGDSAAFEVTDLNGRVGLAVNPDGTVNLGGSRVVSTEGFQVSDLDGRIALEVKPDGKTYVYDPAFSTGGGVSAVKMLHVFLAAGQSNMSGRGLPITSDFNGNDGRIFEYGAKVRTLRAASVPLDMLDTATGLSPATSFARNYLTMQPSNVGVLIIPAAHGSTGFTSTAGTRTWTPNAASAPEFDLPALAVAQTLEAIAAATAAGYTVQLQGILWHQGENNSSTSTASYEVLLDSLVAYFRSQLGAPNLPFIAGQMCPEGMDVTPTKYNIDKAHAATPARLAYAGFAQATRGGHNTGDTTHFSKVGVDYLGKTYLSGFFQAAGNVLAAPPSAPVTVTASKAADVVTVAWNAPPATVTAAESYALYGAGNATTWTAPTSHISGYRVELKTGAGAWATITRAWGMNLTETITGVPAGTTQARVTALNGAAESSAVTVTATGA